MARRFVTTLLHLEIKGAIPQVGRELRATATPSFARFLLEREPRRPAGLGPSERGTLVALEPLPGRSAARLEFAAMIARAGTETGVIVVLQRRGGAWWVAALH